VELVLIRVQVVDDVSSCLGDASLETVRDIESDHRDMCRFSSLDDPRYQKVAAAIRRIVQPTLEADAVHREQLEPSLGSRDPEPTLNRPTLSEGRQNELIAELRFKQMDARLWTLKSAQAKTCRWLLKHKHYRDWTDAKKLTDHHGFFWIKGKPGTGKSTMMKFLFLEAKKTMRGSLVLSFFFNARGEAVEKSTSGLYRSLLSQLLEKAPETRSMFDSYGPSGFNAIKENGWQNETLREALAMALTRLGGRRVVCFIDALDECPEDDVRGMVAFFEELGDLEKEAEFRVCFSSRHYPEISIRTGLQLALELEQDHTNDITLYLDTHLKLGADTYADDIKAEVLRKSSNIFLWVVLVIPILNKEFDRGRIKALKKRLTEIPAGLHELFLDILTRDNKNTDELLLCIQWILFGSRPLSPEEFRSAVEMGGEIDSPAPSEPCHLAHMTAENLRKFVLDVSKGLAEITKSKEPTVQFIHESVRDFLLKDGGMAKLFQTEEKLEGHSHDVIKRICQRCLCEARVRLLRHQTERLGHINLRERRIFIDKYPLVCYAAEFVFSHANWAQKLDINQLPFLHLFDLVGWDFLSTTLLDESERARKLSLQKPERCRHLLYVLAEYGTADLIKIHPERSTHLDIKSGRFVYPLLAALYAGHHAAARAFLDLPPLKLEQGPGKGGVAQPRTNLALKKSDFIKGRHLLATLCQAGDADILRAVLESGLFPKLSVDKSLASLCLDEASSEAVVDVLVEFNAVPTSVTSYDSDSRFLDLEGDSEYPAPVALPQLRRALKINPLLATESWGYFLGGLLGYAAARGFEQIAKLGIRYANDEEKLLAFERAATGDINQSGRLSIIKSLMEAGVSPEWLPLIEMMEKPHNEEVTAMLLSLPSLNLDQAYRSAPEWKPLLWALQNERKKYVKLLLSAGANPMTRTHCGETALILAVKMSDSSSFLHILAHAKCEPDGRDDNGRTALFWCATVADDIAIQMVSALVQRADVDPNARDNSGQTVLMQAVRSGNPKLVDALLKSTRIDPDLAAEHYRNRTPLWLAVQICRFQNHRSLWEIARLLLLTGPHTRKSLSPLSFARRYGLVDMVNLIERSQTYWTAKGVLRWEQDMKALQWTGVKTSWQLMNRRRCTE